MLMHAHFGGQWKTILRPSCKKQCQQLEGGDFLSTLRSSWLMSNFLSVSSDCCNNADAAIEPMRRENCT